jgi:hypothetical protein
VRITPQIEAPMNDYIGRHNFGVREYFYVNQRPNMDLQIKVKGGLCKMSGSGFHIWQCPLYADKNFVTIQCEGESYKPEIIAINPKCVKLHDVSYSTPGAMTNQAGCIALTSRMYVYPLDVSFSQISIQEVPCERGVHTGYFNNNQLSAIWSHSRENGAGVWCDVKSDNFFAYDEASVSLLYRVTEDGFFVLDESYGWINGLLVWEVPFGWNERNTRGLTSAAFEFFHEARHVVSIDETGTVILRKIDNEICRHVSGSVYLNGQKKE